MPLNDFVQKYEKSKNEVFALRNVRETIPKNYCRMFNNITEREHDPEVLSFLSEVVVESLKERLDEPNALAVAKQFIEYRDQFSSASRYEEVINSQINLKLVAALFADQLTPELREIGRKTLDAALRKTQHLVELVLSMKKFSLSGSLFEQLTLSSLLELLKGLDATEQRAAKMLDKADLAKL